MMTKIAIAAGEIWLALDKHEGICMTELFEKLECRERSQNLLWMALGWLIYEKHIKYVTAKNGGRLLLISPKAKEGLQNEKSNQNDFAINNA